VPWNVPQKYLSNNLGCGRIEPAQIAKALTWKAGDRYALLMARGDARLDNAKVKKSLGGKTRLVPPDEAAAFTGHVVGGVCPFGLASPLPIYCDIQLRRFELVVTGGGATHCAVQIDPLRMATITGAQWVDVCGPANFPPCPSGKSSL
jgi:prolyl-tRNA editing enzyme YbaK/EbsC (Cys-tRNA(Pro) deacylase)